MLVNIGGHQVLFPERDLCPMAQIERAQEIIDANLPSWVERLRAKNPTHTWLRKGTHAKKTVDGVVMVMNTLGVDTETANAHFLLWLAGNHDWGRFAQALIDEGDEEIRRLFNQAFGQSAHGVYTVKMMEECGTFLAFNPVADEIAKYVLVNHCAAQPIFDPDNATAWLFLAIIRVADKFATMMNRTDAYLTPEGIVADSELMRLECEHAGRPWHGEGGYINPEVIDAFLEGREKHQTFERSLAVSYEAYMTFYLGWLFEIDIKEILQAIVDSDFVGKIFSYLKRQKVPDHQLTLIYNTVVDYLAEYGIVLLPEA